jgi:hypothetical protein
LLTLTHPRSSTVVPAGALNASAAVWLLFVQASFVILTKLGHNLPCGVVLNLHDFIAASRFERLGDLDRTNHDT